MEKINVNSITDKQKLTIENGINTYLYIMNHQKDDDDDFRDVYYDFYLKAGFHVFSKTKKNSNNPNWDVYFDLLKKSTGEESLVSIVEELKEKLTSNRFQFSFASKLLHTKNPNVPIYDSKVAKYLKDVYKKELLFGSDKKDLSKIDTIKNDWKILNEWYNDFLKTDEAKEWIDWFDKEFPKGKNISNIKKIDTIIFACVN